MIALISTLLVCAAVVYAVITLSQANINITIMHKQELNEQEKTSQEELHVYQKLLDEQYIKQQEQANNIIKELQAFMLDEEDSRDG